MTVLETERLRLRKLSEADAPFIHELVNEPAWLRFIGDKGVRTIDDARAYINQGPVASYERFGFGLYLVELKSSTASIGICGLIKRDTLPDVDLGFAFLTRFHGNGYARESAAAALEHGRRTLGLKRIVAITVPDHQKSIRVLEHVGFAFERRLRLPGDSAELSLYASEAPFPEQAAPASRRARPSSM